MVGTDLKTNKKNKTKAVTFILRNELAIKDYKAREKKCAQRANDESGNDTKIKNQVKFLVKEHSKI